jgi:hypothetical protein
MTSKPVSRYLLKKAVEAGVKNAYGADAGMPILLLFPETLSMM